MYYFISIIVIVVNSFYVTFSQSTNATYIKTNNNIFTINCAKTDTLYFHYEYLENTTPSNFYFELVNATDTIFNIGKHNKIFIDFTFQLKDARTNEILPGMRTISKTEKINFKNNLPIITNIFMGEDISNGKVKFDPNFPIVVEVYYLNTKPYYTRSYKQTLFIKIL